MSEDNTMEEQNKNLICCKGELHLGDFSIPCYVLEDGRRVLSGRKMQEALKMVDEAGQKSSGHRLPVFLSRKSLEPFIAKYLEVGTLDPVVCYDGGTKINGYRAEALADICEVFLEARKHIDLTPRQSIIADQCEVLMRGFARIGIIALVDEATGYQHEREQDELQKILKAYIAEELLPWQKRFPDVFYQELFRLNGWDYTVRGIKRRPGIIGKWTNKLIYEQLPPGVLDELKRVTPKSARLHQNLTADIGQPELAAQITQIVTIFRLSDNMGQMWSNFNKLQSRQSGQLELPFEFDENGHTLPSIDEEPNTSEVE